jgi:hypothetical protein
MRAMVHGPAARMFFQVASIATGGLYRHHDTMNQSLEAKLDEQRRNTRLKLQVQSLPPERVAVVASDFHPDPLPPPAKLEAGQ